MTNFWTPNCHSFVATDLNSVKTVLYIIFIGATRPFGGVDLANVNDQRGAELV